jgi:hypothetical protein
MTTVPGPEFLDFSISVSAAILFHQSSMILGGERGEAVRHNMRCFLSAARVAGDLQG